MRKILAVGSIGVVAIIILAVFPTIVESKSIEDVLSDNTDNKFSMRDFINFLEDLIDEGFLFIFGLLVIIFSHIPL